MHGVNAAGSAYEVRPLFEHYARTRHVYALDLPGFGVSQRRDRVYTPRLMIDAVHALAEQIQRIHGPAPIDALALSLWCEFLARAASERPDSLRCVALVSPTGFEGETTDLAAGRRVRALPALPQVLNFPLWSRALFDLLVCRPSIRFFLERPGDRRRSTKVCSTTLTRPAISPGHGTPPFTSSPACCSTLTSGRCTNLLQDELIGMLRRQPSGAARHSTPARSARRATPGRG